MDKPLFKAIVHEKHKKHEQKQKIKAGVRQMRRAPAFVPDISRNMLGNVALLLNLITMLICLPRKMLLRVWFLFTAFLVTTLTLIPLMKIERAA